MCGVLLLDGGVHVNWWEEVGGAEVLTCEEVAVGESVKVGRREQQRWQGSGIATQVRDRWREERRAENAALGPFSLVLGASE